MVELGELVALVVRGDIESGLGVIATDDEGPLDDGVVGLAVYGSTAEDVLARSLETGEETTDQVGRHEHLGELVVVLVVKLPEGVLLGLVVLPEPLQRIRGVVVGVLTLPLVQDESRLRESLKGVLGLGSLLDLLLFLVNLLGLGLGGSLGSSLLLGGLRLLGGLVLQDNLVDEVELGNNSGVDGLVVDGLIPTGNVGVRRAPGLVIEELEASGDDAGGEEVSEGDALASQVGVVKKVLLDHGNGLSGSLLGVLNALLVVGVTAKEGTEPSAERGEDLGVEVRHPLQDGGIVLLGLAEESGLLVLGGD